MDDVRRLLAEGYEHSVHGRLREAAACWEQVLRIDPGNERAREYLRNLLGGRAPGREAASQAPAPRPDRAAEAQALMQAVPARLNLDDFSGALEILERVLRLVPDHADALRLRDECTENLVRMYESVTGPAEGVPELAVGQDEIIWLNLDHRAGFVLSQIDGQITYDDLYAVCGMSKFETAKILAMLLQMKVIRTKA